MDLDQHFSIGRLRRVDLLAALPEAQFCMACGTALQAEVAQAPAGGRSSGAGGTLERPGPLPDGRSGPTTEERRTVTVLFADLSGYTAIAERLDPEAVKALVD